MSTGTMEPMPSDDLETTTRVHADPFRENCFVVTVGGADQSYIDLDDPTWLEFDYMQRIMGHIDAQYEEGQRLRVVHVGGAGMTLARCIAHTRPTSAQIVCEPDTALTDEVREKAPLGRHSGIKVRATDGRNGVAAMPDDYADVVIVDAFNGRRVPGPLATVEWFSELRRIVNPDGLVCMNVTDTHPFGWTRRVLSGLGAYFGHTSMSAESSTWKGRRFGNVILAASPAPLALDAVVRQAASAPFPYRVASGEQVGRLVGGAQPFQDGGAEDSPLPPTGIRSFS